VVVVVVVGGRCRRRGWSLSSSLPGWLLTLFWDKICDVIAR
jgi:hypothetical protein